MKKIVRLTESDLARIVKRVISEQTGGMAALAKFGDFLVNENHRTSQTSAGIPVMVYASMGSTVTPMMLPDEQGNKVQGVKIDVNAVTYSVNGNEVKKVATGNIPFYQICGAQANFFAKDTIKSVLTGGAGYNSKPGGPIQTKATQACTAAGYKGQIQKPAGAQLA
jgi:hypothetical protein